MISDDVCAVAYAASAAQRRMWMLHEAAQGQPVYNLSFALRPAVRLDADAMRRAVRELARRQPVLRTRYRLHLGVPVQIVDAEPFELFDVRDAGSDAGAQAQAEGARGFDLTADHPLRAALLRALDGDVLVVTLHHVATDGWSTALVLGELAALYDAERTGAPAPLEPLVHTYADFAAWEAQVRASPAYAADLAFWKATLSGAPPLLNVPTDRPRAAHPSFAGTRLARELPASAGAALLALARERAVTPFAVFTALFAVVLARHAGQSDLVLGTMTAGRERSELRALAGQMINTLALRLRVDRAEPLAVLLARTQATVAAALAHAAVPFDDVVAAAAVERVAAAAPLAQVFINFVDAGAMHVAFGGAPAAIEHIDLGVSKFDLGLQVEQRDERFALVFEYAGALFDRATVAALAEQLVAAVESAVAPGAAARPVADVALISARDAAAAAGRARVRAGTPPSVPALFARQAARDAGAPAVSRGAETISYGELDRRANAVARALRARGVRAGTHVGVCAGRSPELIAALLGIWRAGAAYVPLDPDNPQARLERVLAAAAPVLVIAERRYAARFARGTVLLLEDASGAPDGAPAFEPPCDVHPDALAYVVTTSGSRGAPKAIGVPHRALSGFFEGDGVLRLGPQDRVLAHSSFAWDMFVLETWAALAQGACCVLAPDERVTPDALARWAQDERVTFAWFTSSLFAAFAPDDVERLSSLRRIVVGGDAPRHAVLERARAALPHAIFANGYGPSECACLAALAAFAPNEPIPNPVPIGDGLGDRTVYVLDERLEPLPPGVLGELYVGGDAVMRGYLGNPALTAERCLPDPFAGRPGARMYATGDLVRRRADGRIVFAGRRDDQRKIRGYRVELGEVEAALRAADGVDDAAAVLRTDDGIERLVAYVVPRGAFDEEALLAELAAALPPYALPSPVVVVDAIPLSPNGKADPSGLPAPFARTVRERAFVPPRTDAERAVAACYREVLGLEQAGANDDFFALGGHSLLVGAVVAHLKQLTGVTLLPRNVFAAPAVAQLAALLEAELAGAPAGAAVENESGAAPAAAAADERTAPRSPTERTIAAVWSELLGVAGVALEDEFFALGGHSLLAARAAAKLKTALGRDVSLALLYANPALGELAALIDEGGA